MLSKQTLKAKTQDINPLDRGQGQDINLQDQSQDTEVLDQGSEKCT